MLHRTISRNTCLKMKEHIPAIALGANWKSSYFISQSTTGSVCKWRNTFRFHDGPIGLFFSKQLLI